MSMLSVTLAARPARTDVDAIPQLVEYPAVLAKETKLTRLDPSPKIS
jgi:hypothetical protein